MTTSRAGEKVALCETHLPGEPRDYEDLADQMRTISQGICAVCEIPAPRVDDRYECPCCGMGWRIVSVDGRFAVTLILPVEVTPYFGRTIGGAS